MLNENTKNKVQEKLDKACDYFKELTEEAEEIFEEYKPDDQKEEKEDAGSREYRS